MHSLCLRLPFTSDAAKKAESRYLRNAYTSHRFNRLWKLPKQKNPYSTYKGSHQCLKGEFQFNMWGIKEEELSGNWDWKKLRKNVLKHGVRNSLLVAPMPTASTSQILGNNEAF